MELWKNDKIQFARLLAEIDAIGLSATAWWTLCDSMDLEPEDIQAIFDRAEEYWDFVKENRPRTSPMTVKEMEAAVDDDSFVSGVISVELSEVIDLDLEGFLDLIGERLVEHGELLMQSSWDVIGHAGDTLLLNVTGDVSQILDLYGQATDDEVQ